MNDEMLKKFSDGYSWQDSIKSWLFYLLVFAVSSLGSYFGAYIKNLHNREGKGQCNASDLQAIKDMLKMTTEISETITTN